MTTPHFAEILSVFDRHGVEVLIVGGYAMAAHGRVRATEDLDLWVRDSAENLQRLQDALEEYLSSAFSDSQASQLRDPQFMISFGRPPSQIDIHKTQPGVRFEQAWASREETAFGAQRAYVVSREVLTAMKRASVGKRPAGSPKSLSDQADLAWLEAGPSDDD